MCKTNKVSLKILVRITIFAVSPRWIVLGDEKCYTILI